MKIESHATDIRATDEQIFRMLDDCRNWGKYMPAQIKNEQADINYCEFEMEGMAKIKIEIAEKQEFCYIAYQLHNDKNMPLSFTVNIKKNDYSCDLLLKIDMDIPIFLQPMVKKPLQKAADMIVERIKTSVEQV